MKNMVGEILPRTYFVKNFALIAIQCPSSSRCEFFLPKKQVSSIGSIVLLSIALAFWFINDRNLVTSNKLFRSYFENVVSVRLLT